MAANSCSPTFGSFRSDFGTLTGTIQLSWSDNPWRSLLYTEEFLCCAFDYPAQVDRVIRHEMRRPTHWGERS